MFSWEFCWISTRGEQNGSECSCRCSLIYNHGLSAFYFKDPVDEYFPIGNYSSLSLAPFQGNTDIGGELHIERLYLFSLIWSFGGLLDESDRRRFSELLLSLTTALPDYDQEISVFDYYVDESGEWDPWQSRLDFRPSRQCSNHKAFASLDRQQLIKNCTKIGDNIIRCASPSYELLGNYGVHSELQTQISNNFLRFFPWRLNFQYAPKLDYARWGTNQVWII